MSTMTYSLTATETSQLRALTETAERKAADCARQKTRLSALIATFEKQKLTLSPAAYAAQQSEIEQQSLIVADAERVWSVAEAERAVVWSREDQQRAEAARLQQLQTIDSALAAKTAEITDLQYQLGVLPEKLVRARQEHMALQAERSRI